MMWLVRTAEQGIEVWARFAWYIPVLFLGLTRPALSSMSHEHENFRSGAYRTTVDVFCPDNEGLAYKVE